VIEEVRRILQEIGENPTRDGLQKTPLRVDRALRYLTSGYRMDAKELLNGALFDVAYDEMVIVKDIEVFSLCEHHLLPFFGKCHVAYIPDGRVIGLSKIPRLGRYVCKTASSARTLDYGSGEYYQQFDQAEGCGRGD
jgi:GTP cyclohydrolase I